MTKIVAYDISPRDRIKVLNSLAYTYDDDENSSSYDIINDILDEYDKFEIFNKILIFSNNAEILPLKDTKKGLKFKLLFKKKKMVKNFIDTISRISFKEYIIKMEENKDDNKILSILIRKEKK